MCHLNAYAALWAVAATAAAPGLRAMLRLRLRRGKELPGRLPERRGIDPIPRPQGQLIWLHAASVGETTSILPVLLELTAQAPAVTILLTTGTVTSAELLARRLPELGLERRVLHRFVPLDVPAWTRRFVDHWHPDVAGFVESELWPNLLAACRARSVPAMLVNARVSDRSFAQWQRVPGLARHILNGFAIGAFSADYFGRKPSLITAGFATIVLGAIYPFVQAPAILLTVGFFLIVAIYVQVAILFGVYTPELFPTEVRLRANGICNTIGRAATIVSPFIVLALFKAYGVGGVLSLMIGLVIVSIIVVYLWGIEPAKRGLEQLETATGGGTGAAPRAARA